MKIPKFLYALIAAGALVLTTATAEAALTLRLTQGASIETVVDQSSDDGSDVEGVVIFNGGIGTFTTNVSTGISKPAFPVSHNRALMDLNSVDLSSGSGGTLVIELTDTDFTLDSASMWSSLLNFGGTTQGLIDVEFWLGLDNAEFSQGVLLGDLGSLSGGAFSGVDTVSGGQDLSDPFSLTLVATIQHGSGTKLTSFDAEGSVMVPTPGTLPLFLAGITALGLGAHNARRRRRVAA